MASLLGQWCGGFEAAKRQYGKHHARKNAREMVWRERRTQRGSVRRPWPGMEKKCDGQRDHDQDFYTPEKSSGAHRELHTVIRKEPDHGKCSQCKQPPGHADVQTALERVGKKVTEKSARGGGTEDVVDEVTPGCDESDAASESPCGKGIVATARRHVPGKLGNGIADKEAHDCGQEKRDRHIRSRFGRDDGEGKYDVGCRCDVGDAVEDEFPEAERIAAKMRRGICGWNRCAQSVARIHRLDEPDRGLCVGSSA